MEECRQQNSLRALDVGSVLESSSAADGAVLVVEDDIRFARLLAAELAVHGLSAVGVTSAEAALDRLASARPRALVVDPSCPACKARRCSLTWRRPPRRAYLPWS
jgi:DNA-binding response OmpR family regulator